VFASTSERSEFLDAASHYCREGQVLAKPGSDVTTVRPLVVHGKRGSGKSFALACLAKEYPYFDDWSSAVCIFKVVRLTLNCDTIDKVIQSIAEHLCVLSQTFLQSTLTVYHIQPPACVIILFTYYLRTLAASFE
jgi:hypothetical protein